MSPGVRWRAATVSTHIASRPSSAATINGCSWGLIRAACPVHRHHDAAAAACHCGMPAWPKACWHYCVLRRQKVCHVSASRPRLEDPAHHAELKRSQRTNSVLVRAQHPAFHAITGHTDRCSMRTFASRLPLASHIWRRMWKAAHAFSRLNSMTVLHPPSIWAWASNTLMQAAPDNSCMLPRSPLRLAVVSCSARGASGCRESRRRLPNSAQSHFSSESASRLVRHMGE